MLFHYKGGKRPKREALKASERFCSQMFGSNIYLQAVRCCREISQAQAGPDIIIEPVLVQDRLVLAQLYSTVIRLSLSLLWYWVWYSESHLGGGLVVVAGNVPLKSPGVHSGRSGQWGYRLSGSSQLDSGPLVSLPEGLHLPCHWSLSSKHLGQNICGG